MHAPQGAGFIGPARKKSGLLVAIPCFSEAELLQKHLQLLEGQKGANFDVLVVLGNGFDGEAAKALLKPARPFSLILLKREEDTGSAGGFFTAQKFALDEGYEHIVMADVDCLPMDAGLLAALHAKREAGLVSPTEVFEKEDGGVFAPAAGERARFTPIYHYTLLSARLMRKYGLVFAPAFHGAEDAEYAERLRGETRVFVDERVSHPFIIGDRTYRKPDRFWAYTLNTILLVRGPRWALNLLRLLLSALVMFFFFPPFGRTMAVRMMGLLFGYAYGKRAMDSLKADLGPYLVQEAGLPQKAVRVSYPQYLALGALAGELFRAKLSNFRKEIVIEGSSNDLLVTMQAAWARRAYYKTGGQYLLIADNCPLLCHLIRMVLFVLALMPFMALSLLIFLPIKLLRQPDTNWYGL